MSTYHSKPPLSNPICPISMQSYYFEQSQIYKHSFFFRSPVICFTVTRILFLSNWCTLTVTMIYFLCHTCNIYIIRYSERYFCSTLTYTVYIYIHHMYTEYICWHTMHLKIVNCNAALLLICLSASSSKSSKQNYNV